MVYLIQSNKENCQLNRYVEETKRKTKDRISEQRGYIFRKEKKKNTTGEHLNQAGHNLANMNITILDASKEERVPR